MFTRTFRAFWSRPGGLSELIKQALPAGISQACFSLMMFTDRYLLSPLGKEAPAASMISGLTSYLLVVFFCGVLSYITPLTGQFLGAKKNEHIGPLVHQGFFIALVAYPAILIFGLPFASFYFELSGIHESQRILAEDYFSVINLSALFILINVILAGFFAGIGRTYIVMTVNALGMLINIPLSYYFIKYGIAGNWDGVSGAALGSLVSTAFMSFLFLYLFMKPIYQENFKSSLKLKFNSKVMSKLLKFGTAGGVEFLLTFSAFTTFMALFHSYGINEAFSATIVLNWEIVAFMPMFGVSIGLMSLVGKYMGAEEVDHALETIKSGFILSAIVMLMACLLFIFKSEELIKVFLLEGQESFQEVLTLSSTMLKLVCFYCIANSFNLILSGTLRASGDTKAVMYIAIVGQWLMLVLSYLAIKFFQWDPVLTWTIFCCSLFFETIFFSLRFLGGKWKRIKVV